MTIAWICAAIALLLYIYGIGELVLRAVEKRLNKVQQVILSIIWLAVLITSTGYALTTGQKICWLVAGATALPAVVVVLFAIYVYSFSPGC